MNKNKGFTLVELLVVIVILGVITAMSWPMITRIQESNKMSKYETYGDAMVTAAKLYIDAYEEDVFQYEDDLTPEEREEGQCKYIMLYELIEHDLIKDYSSNDMSCNSDNSFVKVTRRKGRYEYSYYMGCGKAHADGSKLETPEVYFTLPEQNVVNYPDPATCSITTKKDSPTIHSMSVVSNIAGYNSKNVRVTVEATDPDSNTKDLKVCVSASDNCTDTSYVAYGNNATFSTNLELTSADYNGSVTRVYAKVKDPSGNISTLQTTYRTYQKCSERQEIHKTDVSECSKKCNGGTKTVRYFYVDKFLNAACPQEQKIEPCNTMSCCKSKQITQDEWQDVSGCSRPCGGGTKVQAAMFYERSTIDPSVICAQYRKSQEVQCNTYACTPYVSSLYGINNFYCDNTDPMYDGDRHCNAISQGPGTSGAGFYVQAAYVPSTNYHGSLVVFAEDQMYTSSLNPYNPGYYKMFCNWYAGCSFPGIIQGTAVYFFRDDVSGRQSNKLIITINPY